MNNHLKELCTYKIYGKLRGGGGGKTCFFKFVNIILILFQTKQFTRLLEFITLYKQNLLKGKFSSGREGALASKFNYDFK